MRVRGYGLYMDDTLDIHNMYTANRTTQNASFNKHIDKEMFIGGSQILKIQFIKVIKIIIYHVLNRLGGCPQVYNISIYFFIIRCTAVF